VGLCATSIFFILLVAFLIHNFNETYKLAYKEVRDAKQGNITEASKNYTTATCWFDPDHGSWTPPEYQTQCKEWNEIKGQNATEYAESQQEQIVADAFDKMMSSVTNKMAFLLAVVSLVSAIGTCIALCVLNSRHKRRWRRKRRMMRRM